MWSPCKADNGVHPLLPKQSWIVTLGFNCWQSLLHSLRIDGLPHRQPLGCSFPEIMPVQKHNYLGRYFQNQFVVVGSGCELVVAHCRVSARLCCELGPCGVTLMPDTLLELDTFKTRTPIGEVHIRFEVGV